MHKREIEEIYKEIVVHGSCNCILHQQLISFTLVAKRKNIELSAVVYKGEHFIPLSVRSVAKGTYFAESEITPHLFIDEEAFSIYLCHIVPISKGRFVEEVALFYDRVLFWQELFSEKDTQDLIVVPRVKK